MKKLNIVLTTTVALSCFAYAGGDILPTVFETEEVYVPVEEVYIPEPEVIVEPEIIADPIPDPVLPDPEPIVPVVAAPSGFYGGLGFTLGQYKAAVGNGKDKTAGIIARLGYDFNEYVGVEARGIRTNWKENGGKIKHAGVFLKPMYPVTDDVELYGLAGYAKTTTQGTLPRVDEKAFAWGAGLAYDLGSIAEGFELFTDYERLVQKSGSADLDTLNFGLKYDF